MMCLKSNDESTQLCVDLLKNGKVIILPTDTVYGFSGIANQDTDIEIRKIKGREETKPLIQLIAKPTDIYNFTNKQIPESLLSKWPGPLTIIVKNTNSDITTAFRCPGDLWLRTIIEKAGYPIFSTSVNRSGKPVLENINDIQNEFENEVSLIISDGDKKGSKPSTIVSIVDDKVKIIRQGSLVI